MPIRPLLTSGSFSRPASASAISALRVAISATRPMLRVALRLYWLGSSKSAAGAAILVLRPSYGAQSGMRVTALRQARSCVRTLCQS